MAILMTTPISEVTPDASQLIHKKKYIFAAL